MTRNGAILHQLRNDGLITGFIATSNDISSLLRSDIHKTDTARIRIRSRGLRCEVRVTRVLSRGCFPFLPLPPPLPPRDRFTDAAITVVKIYHNRSCSVHGASVTSVRTFVCARARARMWMQFTRDAASPLLPRAKQRKFMAGFHFPRTLVRGGKGEREGE